MKKIISGFFLLVAVFALTGCGNKEIVKHCTIDKSDKSQNYTFKSDYELHAKNNEITKVVTEEIVSSDNEQIISYLETYLKKTYGDLDKKYGGYTNEVIVKGDKLTSLTTVDYSKMDLKAYVKDNSVMKKYVDKNNKITIKGIIDIYESLGATCK